MDRQLESEAYVKALAAGDRIRYSGKLLSEIVRHLNGRLRHGNADRQQKDPGLGGLLLVG